LAVSVTAIVLIVLLALDREGVRNPILAFCAVALFVAGWFALGARSERGGVATIVFVAIIAAASGAGTASYPSFAIIQCIAYPLIWTHVHGLRKAIIGNITLSIAVAIGFVFSLGTSPSAVVQTVVTSAISLAFSLAIGFWFSRIYQLVHERDELIVTLNAARDELATVSRDAGAAAERERLSRELHDTIAQELTGLVMTAERGRRELAIGDTAAAQELLAILEDAARSALSETRALVASGTAKGVDAAGLSIALGRLAERFSRDTGIAVSVSADAELAIDRDQEVVLLRCAQEALANVRKHASARMVTITLTHATVSTVSTVSPVSPDSTGRIRLCVTDDGTGFDVTKFDVDSAHAGFGLTGMRERLALASGSLEIVSSHGAGTTLSATVTVPETRLEAS
jgi:signal transduction histidine kinase